MPQLAQAFFDIAKRQGGKVFAADPERTLDYAEAASLVQRASARLQGCAGRGVGIVGTTIDSLIHLLALDAVGCRIALIPAALARHDGLLRSIGIHTVLSAPDDGAPTAPGAQDNHCEELLLFTSGTTGTPKAVLQDMRAMLAAVHRSDRLGDARWLFPYQLSSFAGLQVFLHALLNGGALTLAPLAALPIERVVRLALRDRVTHISGTPSFYRFLLGSSRPDELARLDPVQITLGGEVVDQPVLDRLAANFPAARITHIYASSEMGHCFSVHDRRAGFPPALLDDPSLPVELRVRAGELQIRPRRRPFDYLNADAGFDAAGYFATGDMVELRGDRYLFTGRKTERINVGGSKVAPAEVEAVLAGVPGVAFAKVYGVPSSVLGQLVKADLVLDQGYSREEVRAAIDRICANRLSQTQRPHLFAFLAQPELLDNGKIQRIARR